VCSTTKTAPCHIKPETAATPPTAPTGTPTTTPTTATTTPQQPSGGGATPEQEAAQPLVEVPGYQITLKALGADSAQYDSYFKAAAGRWQQIITSDLPGFAGPETPATGWFRGFFEVSSIFTKFLQQHISFFFCIASSVYSVYVLTHLCASYSHCCRLYRDAAYCVRCCSHYADCKAVSA
jgi:hypothetical protein